MLQQQSDTKERTRYRMPGKYKVIMYNDDYTTMDFVVMMLKHVFHKSEEQAQALMLKIHNEGQAVVGIYSLDIATTKVVYTMAVAKKSGFPLKLVYLPE